MLLEDIQDDVDGVVNALHSAYAKTKFRPSDSKQFTILASFFLLYVDTAQNNSSEDRIPVKTISLATGSKCLPESKLPVHGDALHDSHAEILARRGFIRWLYEELGRCHTSGSSRWIEKGANGLWGLRSNLHLYLYVSTLPCGDASTSFLAETQPAEMAQLKSTSVFPPHAPGVARGRNNYSLFGVLRTKPGRADSPATLCMSCSDKIARWNVLGVQGALASQLFEPIYLSGAIIGSEDIPGSIPMEPIKRDCERAFFDRLQGTGDLPAGFRLCRPKIYFSKTSFIHSRAATTTQFVGLIDPASSNDSLCWVADGPPPPSGVDRGETTINGTRRGIGTKQRRVEKYRPLLCKASLFKLWRETINSITDKETVEQASIYHDAKQRASDYLAARGVLIGPSGPFAGWVVSGRKWESFDSEGTLHEDEKL